MKNAKKVMNIKQNKDIRFGMIRFFNFVDKA